MIYDLMPAPLKPPSGNLLKLLFSVVSEGLPSKDEEECLSLAGDASELLEMIIHILNTQVETEKGLAIISKRLARQKDS